MKAGGILLANDSHGDASLAYLDADYTLIGVLTGQDERYELSEDELATYFVTRSGKEPSRDQIESSGRGIAYRRSPAAYVFRRASHVSQQTP